MFTQYFVIPIVSELTRLFCKTVNNIRSQVYVLLFCVCYHCIKSFLIIFYFQCVFFTFLVLFVRGGHMHHKLIFNFHQLWQHYYLRKMFLLVSLYLTVLGYLKSICVIVTFLPIQYLPSPSHPLSTFPPTRYLSTFSLPSPLTLSYTKTCFSASSAPALGSRLLIKTGNLPGLKSDILSVSLSLRPSLDILCIQNCIYFIQTYLCVVWAEKIYKAE